jgi:outer membrane protein assembly factor BamB
MTAMNLLIKQLALLLVLVIFTAGLQAQNNIFSQFRGENCSGIASPDAAPPVNLLPDENLLWKTEITSGVSSPCIWGDKIFLTGSNTSDSALITYCLDRKTGAILWEHAVSPEFLETVHPVGSQAASTPTTDGKLVFVYFGSYGLLCYDVEGKLVWEKRMPLVQTMYGSCASPIIADGKLILYRKEQDGTALIALNPSSGETIWHTNLSIISDLREQSNQSHSTPVVWNNQVLIHRMVALTAVNIEDGTETWTTGIISTGKTTPVIVNDILFVNGYVNFGESRLYDKIPEYTELIRLYDINQDHNIQISELPDDKAVFRRIGLDLPYHWDTLYTWKMAVVNFGYDSNKNSILEEVELNQMKDFLSVFMGDHGVIAVHLKADKPEIIWKQNEYVAEVPSLLSYGSRVYMITNGGIATCMDSETGRVIYREKIGASGAYLASPLLAGGNIYYASYNGKITVIKPGDKIDIIAQSNLKEKIGASPVAAENNLYIRTLEGLYAFGK